MEKELGMPAVHQELLDCALKASLYTAPGGSGALTPAGSSAKMGSGPKFESR